jgi:hypothetical protein
MQMEDPILVTAPIAEPVTLAEIKLQLGFGPMQDSDRAASQILDDKLRPFALSARRECESFARRVFITQRWMQRIMGFPGSDWRYEWRGYPTITLPNPPVQSIEFVKYVDTFGAVQPLPFDMTYGQGSPQYGYQFFGRNSETAPGRLQSSWARPWPPTRMVPANVMVQFRCGYGMPIVATMTSGSAALTVGGGVTFNPDDAPLLVSDIGLPISVPGAGSGGSTLNTFIASVDGSGNATLKDSAITTVTSIQAWAGRPVPEEIRTAIKLTAADYYDKGCEGGDLPARAQQLLKYYRNLVS